MEDMKIAQRNKCEMLKIGGLTPSSIDTRIYKKLMNLNTPRSIEFRKSKIFRSDFWLMMTWLSRVSFSNLLDNIK